MYKYSEASARAMIKIGGMMALYGNIILLFPASIRDGVYKIIAKNRFKWFGRRTTCRIPSPSESKQLLA